ncbi:MAG: glycosyltransferase family 2 protein [Deltaproteobacteria bacterium]|nr:glycosyltransferase family 2 protein [Deltaproteobacteria bacterium]
MVDLLAVVPAYNAASSLSAVVTGVREQGLPVLVVDDGSTDDTAQVAHAAGAEVLRHPRNRGKGSALSSGFRWALARGARGVLTLDADSQHAPSEIPKFAVAAEDADLVLGRRRLAWGEIPTSSFVGNHISTFFISLFCGKRLFDTQSGFRYYGRRLLTSVPLHDGRFETETELLMRACLLGLRVRWVPIQTIYQSGPHLTHFHRLHDTLRVMRVVLRSPTYPRHAR